MGSSSSKTRRIEGDAFSYCSSSTNTSSFSSSSVRRCRRRRGGVFGSSCLGSSSTTYDTDDHHTDDDQASDHHDEVSGAGMQQIESESDEVKVEQYRTAKIDGSDDMPSVVSNDELGDWTHASRHENLTRASGSSSQGFSRRSLNRSSRFLSRFSFVPGSVSFRLNRAASVGSSRAYPSSPTSFAVCSDEENVNLQGNGNLTSSRYRTSIRSHNGDSAIPDAAAPTFFGTLQDVQFVSARDLVDNELTGPNVSFPSLGSHLHLESRSRRPGDHRGDSREPVDRNVRFSRTLSVGRLRDRVLRRSSFSDLNLSPSRRQETTASFENSVNSLISSPYPLRSMPHSFYASQNNDADILHPRETRHHDLLEHRSNFLERRRRIRSQVRALQRLGNRFENLSGHDRYCILSGQHRTGRCSCRIGSRDSNLNVDGGARASISRIVMLAEALFEVLDEIHQQSVLLSSRPSVSSIGSVPAPIEVVESLPVKVYKKSTQFQCEEAGQCYICLVEYEEGDDMRILPCHHEFHKQCIDKWLKEIHRVCPLCRGDICRSDSSSVES